MCLCPIALRLLSLFCTVLGSVAMILLPSKLEAGGRTNGVYFVDPSNAFGTLSHAWKFVAAGIIQLAFHLGHISKGPRKAISSGLHGIHFITRQRGSLGTLLMGKPVGVEEARQCATAAPLLRPVRAIPVRIAPFVALANIICTKVAKLPLLTIGANCESLLST
jgi:hypothetical protein